MRLMVEEVARKGLTRDGARAVRRAQQRNEDEPKSVGARRPHVFRYETEDGAAKVEVRLLRGASDPHEIVEALQAAAEAVMAQSAAAAAGARDPAKLPE